MNIICYYRDYEKVKDLDYLKEARFVDIKRFSNEIESNTNKVYIEGRNGRIEQTYNAIGVSVESISLEVIVDDIGDKIKESIKEEVQVGVNNDTMDDVITEEKDVEKKRKFWSRK